MEINLLVKSRTCGSALFMLACSSHAVVFADPQLLTIGAPALSSSNTAVHGGQLYEVQLNTDSFTADLIARTVATDGTIRSDQLDAQGDASVLPNDWRAQQAVDSQSQRSEGGSVDDRIIITSGSDGIRLVGRRFRWDHIQNGLTYADGVNEDLKSLVHPGAHDAEKQDETFDDPIVNWVRGGDRYEGAGLRRRDHVLSNIIHSKPQYVGPPFRFHNWEDNQEYSGFKNTYGRRRPMVYVGGVMLHAFRSDSGAEVFAYIPHEILDDLESLASIRNARMFLVDGTPYIADAFGTYGVERCERHSAKESCWLSVLVSGLGFGGKAIFALNVTDPVADAETEAAAADKIFLWEFTHGELGQSTARPIVERLSDGTWTAIVGNGRGAGAARLFVLNVATGELIQKLDLPSTSGANGLSSPTAWDSDFDGDVDFVYAGDLEGNLWRFDFSDAHAEGGVVVSFSGSPLISVSDPDTANPLPITSAPLVSLNPDGGLLVHFGTGLDTQADEDSNGMFGIVDKDRPLGLDPELTVRSVQHHLQAPRNDSNARRSTYRTASLDIETENPVGWKLALPTGERILNSPTLTSRRISFTSINPASTAFDRNWLVTLDFRTGGPPETPVFDLSGEGVFDSKDRLPGIVNGNGNSNTPVGVALGPGVVSGPIVASTAGGRDTLMITHGAEVTAGAGAGRGEGLANGSFDLDTFATEGGSVKQHTHRYDDIYDLNGVNLLTQGGRVNEPPKVESATGILSHNSALRTKQNEREGNVYIEIINPFSVDTPASAAARSANGLDGNLAPPPVIYFQCGVNGPRRILDAPSFNMMSRADRTCRTSDLSELRLELASIHALRATQPECVQTNQPGPVLGDMQSGLNGTYRNGAVTVQARRAVDDEVFWETAVYRSVHVGDAAVDVPVNYPCGQSNEDFQSYLGQEAGDGSKGKDPAGTPAGDVATEHTHGTQVTEVRPVPSSSAADGRVSWHEILE